MTKSNIVLVGFMGTGKTSVGSLLTQRLGWEFVDTDHLIEAETKQSIPELFNGRGEDYFRSVEHRMIQRVLEKSELVVATGGGSVLREDNRTLMLNRGFVVALTASIETVIERVKLDQNRPLLQGDVSERVSSLMLQRKNAYDFADLKVETSGISKDEAVRIILTSAANPFNARQK